MLSIRLAVVLFRIVFIGYRESTEFRLYEKDLELSERRALHANASLAAINGRFNPHFLYNSLNSITSLSKTDPVKTEHMAMSLASYFRKNTNRENTNVISISDELESIRHYLEIEKIRFGDRFQFEIISSKDLN
ncbi:histidine kinase [Robertkochia solimangrovi]|uniref:histidine kinase n=1 Tax=Robertkochia solimangrovi TaxID=2213046 RepID=UPI00117F8C37|nr:histidine kinase [Robertkochia solimangrovi]TRZ42274.1 hypothetical protein DMZ48_14695 [Robertkochia solimangrovi]